MDGWMMMCFFFCSFGGVVLFCVCVCFVFFYNFCCGKI